MRHLFVAVLLLSCLYAEAQLWACKHAAQAEIYRGEDVHP